MKNDIFWRGAFPKLHYFSDFGPGKTIPLHSNPLGKFNHLTESHWSLLKNDSNIGITLLELLRPASTIFRAPLSWCHLAPLILGSYQTLSLNGVFCLVTQFRLGHTRVCSVLWPYMLILLINDTSLASHLWTQGPYLHQTISRPHKHTHIQRREGRCGKRSRLCWWKQATCTSLHLQRFRHYLIGINLR